MKNLPISSSINAPNPPDPCPYVIVRDEHGHYAKGYSGNPRGHQRMKGYRKQLLLLLENEPNAKKAAEVLFSMAVDDRNIYAFRLISEMCGELRPAPQVEINNNTISLGSELIDKAKQFLKDKDPAIDIELIDKPYNEDDQDIKQINKNNNQIDNTLKEIDNNENKI